MSFALTGHCALPPLLYFGALRGELKWPDCPALTWTLTAAAPEGGRQAAAFEAVGEGLHVVATVEADERSGEVFWKIDAARVDVARWWPALAVRYFPALAGVSTEGEIVLTGRGKLEGVCPSGIVTVSGKDLTVRHAEQGWALSGVGVHGDFSLGADGALQSEGDFSLTVQTISTARFGARALQVTARLANLDRLEIASGQVEIAGGFITLDPCVASLEALAVDTRLHIKGIGLQDFVALLPSGLSDARGRIDGELGLGWGKSDGIHIGEGTLTLNPSEPTVLRLAAASGLLTERIPARLVFLPGAVGRWFSLRNQAYDDLHDVEMGKTALSVNSLRVEITPAGGREGHSARVFVDASPANKNAAVKLVQFTVNVGGPLPVLLRLGMTKEFTTELH